MIAKWFSGKKKNEWNIELFKLSQHSASKLKLKRRSLLLISTFCLDLFCRETQADDSRRVVLNELFLFPLGKEMFWKEHVYFFVLQIENEAYSKAKSTQRIKWVINYKTVVDVRINVYVKVCFNRISDHTK